MGLRDVASDAQPKAHAGMPARARCVGSLKWVHHPSELRCRDAGAVIFYRHTGPVWIGGERDRRVAAIFDGVIDQILDGPCQMIMHGVDYQAVRSLETNVCSQIIESLRDHLAQAGQFRRFAIQLALASLEEL